MPPKRGIQWTGCWGKWNESGVYILAAVVGELELQAEPNVLKSAAQEIGRKIQSELQQGEHCVNLHWMSPRKPDHQIMRAALVCEEPTLIRLRQSWQGRPLCDGAATVTWQYDFNTASSDQIQRIQRKLMQHGPQETAFALEIPARWAMVEFPETLDEVRLLPQQHWYDFLELFGVLQKADLLRSEDPTVMHILARYTMAAGAQASFEALTERYLFNPLLGVDEDVNDTHPVRCMLGRYEDIVGKLRPPKSPQAYVLQRKNAADHTAGPETIRIDDQRRRLVIGREEDCDVMLRRPHVSKAHATLEMQTKKTAPLARPTWILTIQDTSANGTWVNGLKLPRDIVQELRVGDKVSFLQKNTQFYPDALTYVVATDAAAASSHGNMGRQTGSSAATGGNGQAFPAPARRAPTGHASASAASRSRAPDVQVMPQQKRPRRTPAGVEAGNPSGAAHGSSASSRGPSIHLAQPVSMDLLDDGVVVDEVVEVSEAPQSRQRSRSPDRVNEDISTWIKSLDGGSLAEYENQLLQLFENVTQIKVLYSNRLEDFYEDVHIEDEDHRLAFASAIRGLKH